LPVEVLEEPPAMSHHPEETSTSGFIVFVDSQVLCEPGNAVREQRHLDLGTPGVTLAGLVLSNYCFLGGFVQSYTQRSSSFL
jgi:hypothetical protein